MIKNFQPTYLYIKQHSVTKKLYFGKTIKDPLNYFGSGTHWMRHIKKHGKEFVETLWYCLFLDENEISNFAINLSKSYDIVGSTDWANLVEENGINSGGVIGSTRTEEVKKILSDLAKNRTHSIETREKMKKSHVGMKDKFHSEETKAKMSDSQSKRKHSIETLIKLSESHMGYIQKIVCCPHCSKEGGISNMKRWHFDNCKLKLLELPNAIK